MFNIWLQSNYNSTSPQVTSTQVRAEISRSFSSDDPAQNCERESSWPSTGCCCLTVSVQGLFKEWRFISWLLRPWWSTLIRWCREIKVRFLGCFQRAAWFKESWAGMLESEKVYRCFRESSSPPADVSREQTWPSLLEASFRHLSDIWQERYLCAGIKRRLAVIIQTAEPAERPSVLPPSLSGVRESMAAVADKTDFFSESFIVQHRLKRTP